MTVHRRSVLRLAGSAALAAAAPRVANAESASLAERLAAYAEQLRYADLDAGTVERVKAHVIDTLGCGIAALNEPVVRICRDVALASGAGGATVIGTRLRRSAELASFANGAAFRYYDLNDNYASPTFGTVHPSDHIAPCLAVAEAAGASAEELIVAIVLAYEINCRLLDASDAATRGWDLPLFSLPAVALAAGKLMKLKVAQLTQAVNLALNDHIPMGQTRTQVNSDWKGLADAEAGRHAIFAADLARRGLTGPAPIFEGRKGFFALVSSPVDVDVGSFGGRTAPFKIHQCGMKPYPAVVYSQTAIVAALAIAKEVDDIDAITAIEIATTRRGYEQAGRDPEKWTPHNRDTADHSLPYITARAMLDGDIHNGSYTAEKLAEPRVVALMRKTTVQEDPAFAKPKGNAPSTRLTVRLAAGREIVHEVNDMPGFPGQPMSRTDIERKFRGNTTSWPKERVDELLTTLWILESAGSLSTLSGQLA